MVGYYPDILYAAYTNYVYVISQVQVHVQPPRKAPQ